MASPLSLAVVAMGLAGLAGTADVRPGPPAGGSDGARVLLAAADCAQAAAQVVDQTGGQLLSAQPAGDGQSCVIIVLIQGDGSSRPRKVKVQVPM
jgi:predicted enzyme related to lactoylglutathione lyase